MRLVIEADDFRKLSRTTQLELIRHFAGAAFVERRLQLRREAPRSRSAGKVEWREPIDLGPDLTVQLLQNLPDNHRKRLRRFGLKGPRVTMRQLLKVTGDTDPRVLSHFQSVITRKLRRIIGDREKRAHLIGWDYESTRWNRDHTQIVDGVYYVTEKTAASLEAYFGG